MSQITTIDTGPLPYTANASGYRVVVDLGFVAVDPPEQIIGERRTTIVDHGMDSQNKWGGIEIEKLTPSSQVLREIARKSPPSQEWWDEDFEGL